MPLTYTTAPSTLDGFGSRTLALAGACRGKLVRLVETPIEHLVWQRIRYSSGMYLVADQEQFNRLRRSGIVQPLAGNCPACQQGMSGERHTCLTSKATEES